MILSGIFWFACLWAVVMLMGWSFAAFPYTDEYPFNWRALVSPVLYFAWLDDRMQL